MKAITPLTIFLRSSPSSRFLSSHFLLFYSTNPQHLHKKTIEGGEAKGTSHSFSSSSSSSSTSQNQDLSRNVKVSVWWDMGNCPIPNGVNAIKVAKNITTALRVNGIKGPVTITAFGDVMQLSRTVQETLSFTGVSLKHLPGGKDTVERSLLADLVFWVSQNPPPAHLFLISGDREFANILHRLRMNNYNILLASQDPAPGVLCSATSIMWHWYHLVKGENFSGKHFSEPPDGPGESWYGRNRVPLEDPFADMEQPPCVQPEDSPLVVTGSKPLEIPKAIVSHIRHVVNSYPKGVDIVKLQLELERNNVPMDENFFGYKKISELLKSLPNVVKLHSTSDGQLFVHSIQTKSPELGCQNNISEPLLQPKVFGTPDQQKTAVAVNKSKVSGSFDQQIAAEPLNQSKVREPFDQPKVAEPINSCVRPTKISDANNGDETQTLAEELKGRKSFVTNNVNGKSSLQVDTAPTMDPPLDTKEEMIQLKEGHSSSIEKNDTNSEVGFCRRVWRTIFRRNNDSSDKESNNSSENHSTNADSFEKRNLEEKSVTSASSNLNESVLEEKEKRESEEKGMFRQIVAWCKFWRASTNSDEEKGQFTEEANQINSLTDINEVFSKVAFWEETLSFLQTKGTAVISQSRTREQLAQRLQKEGPPHLSSLSEGDLSHLVDLLVSEKKWLEESISKTYPFKLNYPARKSAPSSNSHGSNELSSLFARRLSQSNMRVPPYHERGDGKKRDTLSGVCSVESNKNPPGRSKSEILADFQKLVAEKFNRHPNGLHMPNFKSSFRERFGYDLDHQKLGYRKLAALFENIPGVVVDDNFVRPFKKSSESIIPYNVESDDMAKVSNKDSGLSDSTVKQTEHDREWNELGPILESNSKKNCSMSGINGETKNGIERVAYDDDSCVSDDISDSERNDELDGKLLTKNGGEDGEILTRNSSGGESSLLHLLDSFYSKNGRPQGSGR